MRTWLQPPTVRSVRDLGPSGEGYDRWAVTTARGLVAAQLYAAARGAESGVVLVGGVTGGFDSPARGLFPRLATALRDEGVATLRVRFRDATDLGEAMHDVLAGVELLARRGVRRLGLVGHSFGGAVVLGVAPHVPGVRTVVALSAQSYGTTTVRELAPRSLLLVHGAADAVLPPSASEAIFRTAGEPKSLQVLPGAGHGLDEAADEVFELVFGWLTNALVPVGSELERG